jgi:uncharacterized membrane protein YccC
VYPSETIGEICMLQKRFTPSFLESIFLFDPGYARLKMALRGTIGIIAIFFLGSALVHRVHASPSLVFLGPLIAMMGTVALVDLKPSDEKFAILFMTLPACMGVVLSIVLIPWPAVRLVTFLLCTFASVVLRRFGPKWAGVGLVTFMAYFSSLFFPFHVTDIPWIFLIIPSATIFTYVTRFWFIRDRPERTLKQLTDVFALRERRMLAVIIDCLERGRQQNLKPEAHTLPPLWLSVRTSFIQLNELALAIEKFLERSDSRSLHTTSADFQLELFEREFLLRRLWDASSNLFRQFPDDQVLRDAVIVDVIDVQDHASNASEVLPSSRVGELLAADPEAEYLTQDFIQARFNAALVQKTMLGTGAAMEKALQTVAEPPRPGIAPKAVSGLHINTRQAIQATLATALASVLGGRLSAQKWYWASISAFFVFIGASRGDTLIRATLRIVGTVVGLGLGFLLAFLSAERSTGEWTLVVVSISLAIYLSRMTFGFWSALLFSAMFALLYDRMGLMTRDVLLLRTEETLMGALIGVLVASIVLPTSTHAVVREAVVQYLHTMVRILNELRKNVPSQFSRRALIRQLREMDRDLMNIRMVAAPIVGRGSMMKRGGIPGLLHDTTAMGHFLRHLALHVGPQTGKEGFDEACQDLVNSFLQQADRLAKGEQQRQAWTPGTGKLAHLDPRAQYYLKCLRLSLMSLANRQV